MVPDISLDHDILFYIANVDEAVGVGALQVALRKRHILSQATLGRRLLDLDRRGLVVKQKNQGRLLTPKGRAYLQELIQHDLKRQESDEFLQSISGDSIEVLLEVLVARRALEREAARITAQRITPGEIAELHEIVDRQDRELSSGHTGVAEDLSFHARLSELTGNRVLQSALRLVRQQSQFTSLLAFIRYSRGTRIASDHRKILAALAAHDPASAATAMEEHIDTIILSVQTYFRSL